MSDLNESEPTGTADVAQMVTVLTHVFEEA